MTGVNGSSLFFCLWENMILITNNPDAIHREESAFKRIAAVDYIETLEIERVFIKARDYIHLGHKLLTHPLSGSVKPGESPYKSIVLSQEAATLDMQSLLIIEDAIQMAGKFKDPGNQSKWQSKSILEDFRVIDLDLITSGLESINQFRR